jgi:transcriptional regulator with XRE-family HTH domain
MNVDVCREGVRIMLMGERLAELRKDQGLTQKELADILGVDYRSYGNYERGENEPRDEVKLKIARYFNVSLDYLLGLTRQPRPLESDGQYLRLPRPLSPESMEDLKQYIQFLMHKEQTKN